MSLQALPIDGVLPEVLRHLATTTNLVLVAEPGAGKTTRVPLALLKAPWRQGGRILVLEPRRLAARAAAEQMSRLLGESVGETIGYRIRLESKISAMTVIEIITEGVFTRMLIDDPSLSGIAAVLFDEFHERSLDGDLGLALALDTQSGLREDLRLIVMSATLDDERLATHLGNAPIVTSMGRSYPVATFYHPRAPHQRLDEAMAKAILLALQQEAGSILAFLPGAGEIEATRRRLGEEELPQKIDIVPLYGALSSQLQQAAIRPSEPGRRKVVLATSIAETSLTIEGVRVVIDSGMARVPRFDPASGLTRLETVRAPQAAINQRRGRAGRTEAGICMRLWAEPETRSLPAFAVPEIKQADLAPLLLDCAACGVTKPESLRFLDTPPAAALGAGRSLLSALDAIDSDGRLTSRGRELARLPLPPRLAHMLAESAPVFRPLAASLAAILSERGLGGADVDLRQRLAEFLAERSPRADRARDMAARWLGLSGGRSKNVYSLADLDHAGAILALAFPDRIAQGRPDRPGQFVLANGRGAALDVAQPLAREPYLVVAELSGSAEKARILLACSISRAEIERLFSKRLSTSEELTFDGDSRAVRARQVTRLGRVVLSEQNTKAKGEAASQILFAGLADLGLDCLPWTPAIRQFLHRARFLRKASPAAWPDLDDTTLTATLADWLGPFVPGAIRLDDISANDLNAALNGLLQGRGHEITREAPSHFEAPTGSTLAIDYHCERAPLVAIRVQELFGLNHHPMLAGGKVPITFELLSPAHRPIQTTSDLPGFWRGSWADVRAEMRGRYPKHVWPEDPAQAEPTRRAKPRPV